MKANTADPTDFNGTGPFKVSNFSAEDRAELVANDKYFIPGEPKLAKFTIIFFNDENASVDALKGRPGGPGAAHGRPRCTPA